MKPGTAFPLAHQNFCQRGAGVDFCDFGLEGTSPPDTP